MIGDKKYQTYSLFLRVQFATNKYASTQVLLGCFTKLLVLLQYLLVKCIDLLKLLVTGVLVTKDLVLNLAFSGCNREHSLYVKKVFSVEFISSLPSSRNQTKGLC